MGREAKESTSLTGKSFSLSLMETPRGGLWSAQGMATSSWLGSSAGGLTARTPQPPVLGCISGSRSANWIQEVTGGADPSAFSPVLPLLAGLLLTACDLPPQHRCPLQLTWHSHPLPN